MKQGKRGLDNEENVTNMKERETIEKRQTRPVNICRHFTFCDISLMAHHINWLGKEQMIEIDVQSSVKGQGRKSLHSPLTVVAVIIIYAITHTDYTQYINTCNRSQAHPPRYL